MTFVIEQLSNRSELPVRFEAVKRPLESREADDEGLPSNSKQQSEMTKFCVSGEREP